MAVLTISEIQDLAQDRAQINVSTDAPLSAAELLRFTNEAYASVWEIAGGGLKEMDHTNAWYPSTTDTNGTAFSRVTDINEVTAVFSKATDTLGTAGDSTLRRVDLGYLNHLRDNQGTGTYSDDIMLYSLTRISQGVNLGATAATWTSADNYVTSTAAGAFVDLRPGMLVNGTFTGIADNAPIIRQISSSIVELDAVSSDDGDNIIFDGASSNVYRIDYWPEIASLYLPIQYIPQFVPVTATTETPDVNDIESRDIALISAMRIAPLVGRSELVPSIAADVSMRTARALDRKMTAMIHGKQDQ